MTQAIVITYSVFPPCRSRNQTEYFPDLSFAVGLNVFEWLTVSAGKMVMSYESIWIPLRLQDKMRFLKLVSNLVAVSLQPAFQGCRLPLHPHLGHDDDIVKMICSILILYLVLLNTKLVRVVFELDRRL